MKTIIRIIQVVLCVLVTTSFALGSTATANFMVSATVTSSATLMGPSSASFTSGDASLPSASTFANTNTLIQPTISVIPTGESGGSSRYVIWF